MAAGKIQLQSGDLRVATVTFEDGAAGNVSVVMPKNGGVLASETYVDTAINTVLGNVSPTELGYLDGVTSAIQTQLNAKQETLVSATNIKTINSTSLLGSGDIVISATPTSAQVGTATAGLAVGAVGTYASLQAQPAVSYAAGATLAGSSLRYAGVGGDAVGSVAIGTSGTPAGTWRCMGYSLYNAAGGAMPVTLWLRIS